MERWFLLMIPYKVILSILSVLLIILVLNLGGNAFWVGLVGTLSTLGTMLGSLYFGKKTFQTFFKFKFFFYTFLGFTVFLLLLYLVQNLIFTLLLTFLIWFLQCSFFFGAYALISERKNKTKEAMGKLEKIGGFAWVGGTFVGFCLSSFFDLQTILFILFLISLISFLSLPIFLSKRIIDEMTQEFLKEVGVFEKNFERVFLRIPHLHTLISHPYHFKFIEIVPTKHLKFHLGFFFLFIAIGLLFSQYVNFMKTNGLSTNLIFLITLISSTLSAIFYEIAAHTKNEYDTFRKILFLRTFIFLLLAFCAFNLIPLFPTLITFEILIGITWAYLYINSYYFILKLARNEIGVKSFFENLGYILGSFLSGIIVLSFGFSINFLTASILIFLAFIYFSLLKHHSRFHVEKV